MRKENYNPEIFFDPEKVREDRKPSPKDIKWRGAGEKVLRKASIIKEDPFYRPFKEIERDTERWAEIMKAAMATG